MMHEWSTMKRLIYLRGNPATGQSEGKIPLTLTAGAAPMLVQASKKSKVTSCAVSFSPWQEGSGDPAPDNVRPVHGWRGCRVHISPTVDPDDGETVSVDFGDTIYGGTVDVVTGDGVVTGGIIDMGNVEWNKDANRTGVFWGAIAGRKSGSNVIACSGYTVKNVGVTTGTDNYISGKSSYAGAAIFFRDTRFTTKEEATAGTAGVKVVYELATSTPLTLSAASLTIPKGDNYVWAEMIP